MISIRVEADLSKEYLYEVGKRHGLTGEALNYFTYFYAVPLNLEVDENSGEVVDWRKPTPTREAK